MSEIIEAWEEFKRLVTGYWRAIRDAWQAMRRYCADLRTVLDWRFGPARMLVPVRCRQTSRGRVPVADRLTRDMQRIIRKRGGRR